MSHDKINIAILGASGYTGAELIRLLGSHPNANIMALTGDSQAGVPLAEVYPHLADYGYPDLIKIDDLNTDNIDLIFCCLPHGTTQTVLANMPRRLKIIDLSADFRLKDINTYAEWYGHAHAAVELQRQAVYGLSEHNRDLIKHARLIANPGCYPTCSLLPLLPLVQKSLVLLKHLIIDAKSGVSGAGRSVKRNLLYSEVSEGMSAYGVGNHRHMPEIEQELSLAAGSFVTIEFTPHLVPMRRGMMATTYVKLMDDVTLSDIRSELGHIYSAEPFIRLLPQGQIPTTHSVRGSNFCDINVFEGRRENSAILVSTIDNLVKGASGQAVQNMNIMYGWEETRGLLGAPVFP